MLLEIEEEKKELQKIYCHHNPTAKEIKECKTTESEDIPDVSACTLFKLNFPELGYILRE